MSKDCHWCGHPTPATEPTHEKVCLEGQLSAIYQLGVSRGLKGEGGEKVDHTAAELIGRLLEQTAKLRAIAKRGTGPLQMPLAPPRFANPEPRTGSDLDSLVAKAVSWEAIGWFEGRLVSGEEAWFDPRVYRKRFSSSKHDALPLMRHPLMAAHELVHVHRSMSGRWEWQVVSKADGGSQAFMVSAPTAAMAICNALLQVTGGPAAIFSKR